MALSASGRAAQGAGSACSGQRARAAAPRAAALAPPRAAAASASSSSAAAAATAMTAPQQQHSQEQQQQPWRRRAAAGAAPSPRQQRQQRRPSWLAADAPSAAGALASASLDEDAGPSSLGPDAAAAIAYSLQLAHTAEVYEVHAWMLLLGILKDESSTAARALAAAGLDDLYGAWHEVLWALNVSNGLRPRAYTPKLAWAPGAYAIVNGAVRFAGWAGRDKVASHDLLMALAAAGVLENLFPDLALSFDAVRRAVQKTAGEAYKLPDDDPSQPTVMASQDIF
jgi:hypothetical protein